MEVVKEIFFGKNLPEAFTHCMEDSTVYREDVSTWEVIAARKVSSSVRVEWEGREGELVEAWEFELVLL